MISWFLARVKILCAGAFVLVPWLLSMYFFYWLDYSNVWTSETPHRGKLSVLILMSGMILSFLIQSYLIKRKRK